MKLCVFFIKHMGIIADKIEGHIFIDYIFDTTKRKSNFYTFLKKDQFKTNLKKIT